jgi:phage-related protein
MKPAFFLGDSRKCLLAFPAAARRNAGHELNQVQIGKEPSDWKPMPSIGAGVREIRVHCKGEFRVIYLATLPESVYVIHAFGKKTMRTTKHDIDLATTRFKQLMEAKKS